MLVGCVHLDLLSNNLLCSTRHIPPFSFLGWHQVISQIFPEHHCGYTFTIGFCHNFIKKYVTFQLNGWQDVGAFHDIFHIFYAFHLTKMGHLQYAPFQLNGGWKVPTFQLDERSNIKYFFDHSLLTGMGILSAFHSTKMGHIEGAPFQLNGRHKICEIYHENHLHTALH